MNFFSGNVKYLTKKLLIEANEAAIGEKRNDKLKRQFVNGLPADNKFPIYQILYHHDEIRACIAFGNGIWGLLDMSKLRYDSLPVAKFHKDGSVDLEPEEVTLAKRPYEREWRERIVTQPVRKQGKFRKLVLEVYENQCAVCPIDEPSSLRAAHIMPVATRNDDSVNNGICLCASHEEAFDAGILLITSDGDIQVRGGRNINIETSKLRFPKDKKDYPSADYLQARYQFMTNS